MPAAIETDIILLDKGIGPRRYSKSWLKRQRRIEQLMEKASLMVLASHSAAVIRQLCNKALFLRAGHIEEFGNADSVITAYDRFIAAG